MKEIINGKRYDTDKMAVIAECDLKSYSGNYTGTMYVGVTESGNIAHWCESNGQDCHITDWVAEGLPEYGLDGYDIVDEELAKKYNLIVEA